MHYGVSSDIPGFYGGSISYDPVNHQFHVILNGSAPNRVHEISPCPGTGSFCEGCGGFSSCENINRPTFTTDSSGNADLIVAAGVGSRPCNYSVLQVKATGYATILATPRGVDIGTMNGC